METVDLPGHRKFAGLEGSKAKRIAVRQGDARVSADPVVELAAVLGPCVATCLHDPVARIGGMNHILLAEPPTGLSHLPFDLPFALFLMELLVDRMLAAGACKSRLRARLFGGANFHPVGRQIGSETGTFALRYLQQEGIGLDDADLGGNRARRVYFRPVSGQLHCRTSEAVAFGPPLPVLRPASATGDVEFFCV